MPSTEAASALITGVSLSVTTTALILNIIKDKDQINVDFVTLFPTVILFILSFYTSMLYLYRAEFNEKLISLGTNTLFAGIVIFGIGGMYLSLAIPFIIRAKNQVFSD